MVGPLHTHPRRAHIVHAHTCAHPPAPAQALSLLAQLIDADADLKALVSDPDTIMTVFAPTDDAIR